VYALLKKILFRLDAEVAHHLTVRSLQVAQSIPKINQFLRSYFQIHDSRLTSSCWGLSFRNPVGLAAGFDKHAEVYPGLASLGFGFIEVGTLTPLPQEGNPKPRLYRLPLDQAVINRMGFNNKGVAQAKRNLISLPRPAIPIGINLGKNKVTPNEEAVEDYLLGLETLYTLGDYFVINISSPNTKGLRDLQEVSALSELLEKLIMKRNALAIENGMRHPLLVKIAPDLEDEQLADIIQTVRNVGLDGIIATNTTLARQALYSKHRDEEGGLSGRPLAARSTQFIHDLYRELQGSLPIIGVGGIFNGQDAYEKICAGANLVQVYTGMIYQGPGIVKKINRELLQMMAREGISSIKEMVGKVPI
jgi:dihydroorotate dehydrogenase